MVRVILNRLTNRFITADGVWYGPVDGATPEGRITLRGIQLRDGHFVVPRPLGPSGLDYDFDRRDREDDEDESEDEDEEQPGNSRRRAKNRPRGDSLRTNAISLTISMAMFFVTTFVVNLFADVAELP